MKYKRISWEIWWGWVGKDDVIGFSSISESLFMISLISMHELDGTARVICNIVIYLCEKTARLIVIHKFHNKCNQKDEFCEYMPVETN
jgi:hypothetical protein